ncbi:putative DNA-binding domain protein [Vibrio phage VPMCC14]|nr:putative DNA-binding domain protein [Vibrio phage VPMCC14]
MTTEIIDILLSDKSITSWNKLTSHTEYSQGSSLRRYCRKQGIYEIISKELKSRKRVYGFGINDVDYCVQKNERYIDDTGKQRIKILWKCKYYTKWSDMIKRGYCKKEKIRYPTYSNVKVCDDWRYFSKFRLWCLEYEQEHNIDIEDFNLDKDLLSDMEIYSPETSCFLPPVVNMFIAEDRVTSSTGLVGSSYHRSSDKYQAGCNNPLTKRSEYLGLHTTSEQAHLKWAECKFKIAKEIVTKGLLSYDKVLEQALVRKYTNKLEYAQKLL